MTATTPGASAGSDPRTVASASHPPVEVPIASTLCVARNPPPITGGRATGVTTRGRALAAAFTFATISSANSTVPVVTSSFGLVTKSTAPNSIARNVVSQFRSVSDDTITTGSGRCAISLPRNVSPSIRGISTSSVSTSGETCLILSHAVYGSLTAPTTSNCGSRRRISVSNCRINAESSTTNTFDLRTVPPHCRVSRRFGRWVWVRELCIRITETWSNSRTRIAPPKIRPSRQEHILFANGKIAPEYLEQSNGIRGRSLNTALEVAVKLLLIPHHRRHVAAIECSRPGLSRVWVEPDQQATIPAQTLCVHRDTLIGEVLQYGLAVLCPNIQPFRYDVQYFCSSEHLRSESAPIPTFFHNRCNQ